MPIMHHNTPELPEPIWHPIITLPESIPFESRAWLTEEISLTQCLRLLGDFQVKVVGEYWRKGFPSEYALLHTDPDELLWHRDVILMVNKKPYIIARTCVPVATFAHIVSLKNLGNNSLGDLIFSTLNGSRERLEYTSLLPENDLCQIAKNEVPIDSSLWARRSVLNVNENHLLVNEIFLPIMSEITRKSL